MKDKLSYFDVLAYLAPGVVPVWAAQQSLRFVNLSVYFQMENWAFESAVGLALAYVIGQLLSARARFRFEHRSTGKTRAVFRDGLVSENFLLKERKLHNQVLCAEERRRTLIEMALVRLDLAPAEVGVLDAWTDQLPLAQQISHRVYRPLFTLLSDEKRGEKAELMSLRYVFFRNLNVAAAYSCILFVGAIAFNLGVHLRFSDARVVLPSALAVLSAITSRVARGEAIHFAVNHVREVFDSADHFYATQRIR